MFVYVTWRLNDCSTPPPYDPHGGYPVPPLEMTAQAPLPPHNGYAPLQLIAYSRILQGEVPSLSYTLLCIYRDCQTGAYTEMQRKLCSDGKTLKGDCLGLIVFENPTVHVFT
ncbi:hypothetical protein C5167_006259 [Papaver somniferum]|uniref:Uncharacterized protein n=1 Tax=Papaver somniferum TaxID=3469 RepID=A0A4Y7JEK2_PAPSO|nr:hypothetical protein C5167_006259 [Papaver somniferum]